MPKKKQKTTITVHTTVSAKRIGTFERSFEVAHGHVSLGDTPKIEDLEAAVLDDIKDNLKISGTASFTATFGEGRSPDRMHFDLALDDADGDHSRALDSGGDYIAERLKVKVHNGREALAELKQIRADLAAATTD